MLTREDKIAFIVCIPIAVVFAFGMGYFLYSHTSDTKKVEQIADVPKAPSPPKIETTEKRNKDQKHEPQVKKETETLAVAKEKQNAESPKKENNEKGNLIQVPGLPFQFAWSWTINDLKPHFEKITQEDKKLYIAVLKGDSFFFTFNDDGTLWNISVPRTGDKAAMFTAFSEAVNTSPLKDNVKVIQCDDDCIAIYTEFPKKYCMIAVCVKKTGRQVFTIFQPDPTQYTDAVITALANVLIKQLR